MDGSSAGAHDKGGELRLLLRSSGRTGARPGERRREYELLLSRRTRTNARILWAIARADPHASKARPSIAVPQPRSEQISKI